jgi:hypothetical protein
LSYIQSEIQIQIEEHIKYIYKLVAVLSAAPILGIVNRIIVKQPNHETARVIKKELNGQCKQPVDNSKAQRQNNGLT